jgi:activator of 2-hydroxyglutaryl-CoA dehydratase
MARVVREHLKTAVNVPPEGMVQFIGALGAAVLGQRRLEKLGGRGESRGSGELVAQC